MSGANSCKYYLISPLEYESLSKPKTIDGRTIAVINVLALDEGLGHAFKIALENKSQGHLITNKYMSKLSKPIIKVDMVSIEFFVDSKIRFVQSNTFKNHNHAVDFAEKIAEFYEQSHQEPYTYDYAYEKATDIIQDPKWQDSKF